MRAVLLAWAVCALVFAAPVLPTVTGAHPSLPQKAASVAVLVDRAADYVRRYQDELTSVVADEVYTQRVVEQVPRDGLRPLETTLASEVFFMFAGGHEWMAIRDVRMVDGERRDDGPDVRLALREDPTVAVAARLKTYNSRFNVGRVSRNFNEPTLGLMVLADGHRTRFAFEKARATVAGDARLVTIAFRERTGPTLIRGLDGRSVYSAGQITVEPESGRVLKTLLAVAIGSVRATLSTSYTRDERLDLLVPERFGERYTDGERGTTRQTRYEDIVCEATYSNFRRFEVAARIRRPD